MGGGRAADSGLADERGKGDRRSVELDRINSRLERLAAQRRALRHATYEFGDDFDARIWSDAFVSPEWEDINLVLAVTGGYLALVNNMAEAIKTAAKLVGVRAAAKRPGVAGLTEAIRDDGGFSHRQAETFIELYRTRNRLQHSSPDLEADEVHRQVRVVLRHLPRLLKSLLAWLEHHELQLF